MAKFEWQNGTLVSKAKVEIDGKIYEVEPEQYSGQTPLSAENLNQMQDDFLNFIYPVGSIIYNANSNFNPNTEFGGTWEKIKGKMIIGYDDTDDDFNTLKATGGNKTHTQTVEELAIHKHNFADGDSKRVLYWDAGLSSIGGLTSGSAVQFSYSSKTQNTGGGKPMNIMNPYYVANIWIRTA